MNGYNIDSAIEQFHEKDKESKIAWCKEKYPDRNCGNCQSTWCECHNKYEDYKKPKVN